MGETNAPQRIDWQEAKKYLGACTLGDTIVSFLETLSTQIPAKQAARAGATHGTVFVTDFQNTGRGRRDRSWHAVPGRDLTFSVVLRSDIPTRDASTFNFAAALAVLRAIEKRAPHDLRPAIKWPNDVLIGEKKICGIICESAGSEAHLDYAVLGIGINVNRTPEELPPLDSPDRPGATSLSIEYGGAISLPELLADVLRELSATTAMVAAPESRNALMTAYRAACASIGREVRIVADEGECRGIARDISPRGELMVETVHGLKSFDACDVVHARIEREKSGQCT